MTHQNVMTRVFWLLITIVALMQPAALRADQAMAPATQPAAAVGGEITTAPADSAVATDGHTAEHVPGAHAERFVPPYWAAAPFVAILLAIALLPLIPRTHHWWEHNANKLTISLILAAVTLAYYLLRGVGMGHGEHASQPGLPT